MTNTNPPMRDTSLLLLDELLPVLHELGDPDGFAARVEDLGGLHRDHVIVVAMEYARSIVPAELLARIQCAPDPMGRAAADHENSFMAGMIAGLRLAMILGV